MDGSISLFQELGQLRAEGRVEDALRKLQVSMRGGELTAEQFEQAGRFLAKSRVERSRDLHVSILAQCTSTWLAQVLEAIGFAHGVPLSVNSGEYDNVIQELSAPHTPGQRVLILLPWHQRLLRAAGRTDEQRIQDELGLWQEAHRLAQERGFTRVIQVGYDWLLPGALGHHLSGLAGGDVALVRGLNDALRQGLPRGAFFVDLEQLSGMCGRQSFYDPRHYHWTKQPFSQHGLVELATQLFAGIRALTAGPKKVLVLDLDNSLWGGVVGELGPQGIRVGDGPDGEGYLHFQEHVKALSERGVLLAVASKNNLADAREAFEQRKGMALTLDDFAAFEASWEPKATMLRNIASKLNLGLDSFVFFDDNPAEREHIRRALPEVEVVHVPVEPAEYTLALQRGGWFESLRITAEDHARSRQYAVERQREESRGGYGSLDNYLSSLDMRAVVTPLDEADLPRVVQLLGKTNQFNLTTRRHSDEQVRQLGAIEGSVCFTLRMRDRFGDYGLVGCVLAVPLDTSDVATLRVDTWLMSCRVIGRTLELLTMAELARRAQALGYRRILGEYIPSAKNLQVATLYDQLGFQCTDGRPGTGAAERPEAELRRFVADIPYVTPAATFVALEA